MQVDIGFSYQGRVPYEPTPMQAKIERRVAERRDRIIQERLEPWWVMGTGKPLRVTMHSGKTISSQGVKFEGTIRDVFWDKTFIPPFLEDAIEGVFQEVARICRECSLPPEDYLAEAAGFLKGMVQTIYLNMARIDSVLGGRGDSYQRADLFQSYINPMMQRVEDHMKAAELLAGHTRAGEKGGTHVNVNIWDSNNVIVGDIDQTQNLATGNRSSIGKEPQTPATIIASWLWRHIKALFHRIWTYR